MAPNIKVEPMEIVNLSSNGSPRSLIKNSDSIVNRKLVTFTDPIKDNNLSSSVNYCLRIVWRNVIIFTFLHIGAFYGFISCFRSAHWFTIAFGELIIKIHLQLALITISECFSLL